MSPFRSWWAEVENHSRQPSLQSSMSWWKRLSAQCSMLPPFLTDVSLVYGITNKPCRKQFWIRCSQQLAWNCTASDDVVQSKRWETQMMSHLNLGRRECLERSGNNFTSHTQSGKVRTSWGANRPAALAVGLQGIRWRMQKDLRENPNENVDFTAVLLSIPCFPN